MEVILHIGQQKTASTAIQAHLSHLRPELESQGVRYSSAFGNRKAFRLPDLLGRADGPDERSDRKVLRSAFEAELRGGPGKLVVSNENLFTLPARKIRRLHRLLAVPGAKVSVHAYVRRPSEHIASQYSEKVHGFLADGFDEYIASAIEDRKYDYLRIFSAWSEVFGRDAVRVRLFDPSGMAGGPVRDFLSWIGIEAGRIAMPRLEPSNQSSDLASIEAMRHMTKAYSLDPARFDEAFPYDYRTALRGFDDGQRLRVTARQARRLDAAFLDGNRRFAEAYLSEAEGAALSRPAEGGPAAPAIGPDAVLLRALEALGRIPERLPRSGTAVPVAPAEATGLAGLVATSLSALAGTRPDHPLGALARAAGGAVPPGARGADLTWDDLPQAFRLLVRLLAEAGYAFRREEEGRRGGKEALRSEKLRRKVRMGLKGRRRKAIKTGRAGERPSDRPKGGKRRGPGRASDAGATPGAVRPEGGGPP